MSNRPMFPLNEAKYPQQTIPFANESLGYRIEFVKAIRGRRSPMFCSAAESIDAAIVLLAFSQVSQAYLLLVQALEVSLKGLLHEVQQCGVATWMAQNPQLARTLARNNASFSDQLLRENLKEKTLVASFRDVDAFLGFSTLTRESIQGLNSTRNDLAHRGGDAPRTHFYVRDIVCTLFPVLDEVYSSGLDLHLADFLVHDVAREVVVAARFLKSRPNDVKCWGWATSLIASAYFHRRHIAPGPDTDDLDPDRGQKWEDNWEWRKKVVKKLQCQGLSSDVLDDDYYPHCRICNEQCVLATDGELHSDEGTPYFRITSMACPNCHLFLPEEVADLAAIHYGRIDADILGIDDLNKLIKDYGYETTPLKDKGQA